jgi:hypothetical protein
LTAAVAWPAGADTKKVKNQWATVNVCDTEQHPDALGIRARMPGNGKRQKMWMQFLAEYLQGGEWKRVQSGGKSPWRYVGSALFKYEESGWTFDFDTLLPGEGYTMRGVVRFAWRKHGKVLRHTHVLTTGKHSTKTGDPQGYTAATCFMSG